MMPLKIGWRHIWPTSLLCITLLLSVLSGCELVPSRPEAVFILYRERMKSNNVNEARKMLNEDSMTLALDLTSRYKLELPPEDSVLLNILDPQNSPVVTMLEDKFALIHVRTLKGGLRLVRLVRQDTKSHWKINITEELKSFQTFLEAQEALDMMREKAGEYAASWKAFSDQIDRMNVAEDPASKSLLNKQMKKSKAAKNDKEKKKQ